MPTRMMALRELRKLMADEDPKVRLRAADLVLRELPEIEADPSDKAEASIKAILGL